MTVALVHNNTDTWA